MTRDAKLFMLNEREHTGLINKIESQKDHTLKDHVAIYQGHKDGDEVIWYIILSLTEVLDKIIDNYGGEELKEDTIAISVHQNHYSLVYGSETVKDHLPDRYRLNDTV